MRLELRLVLLTQKAVTTGQASVGIWTLLAWIVGFAASKEEAPKEFYSTGASAITTLLLALALTAAWFRLEPLPGLRTWVRERSHGRSLHDHFNALDGLEHKELVDGIVAAVANSYGTWIHQASRWLFRLIYGLSLLAALMVGEMFALLALMGSHPETRGNPRPVLAAVTAGLLGVGLVALLGKRGGDT